jgi:predicted transcriptional regulator
LAAGRRILRNGDGRKSWCPCCTSRNKGRKKRPTLSITSSNGRLLVYCHRCKTDGTSILKKLVALGLLADYSEHVGASYMLIGSLREQARSRIWNSPGRHTDEAVLHAILDIATASAKIEVGLSVRQLALRVHLGEATVARSLHRLANEGWLKMSIVARGCNAAIWALARRPPADRPATLQLAVKGSDRLFQCDPPSAEGDRNGAVHSVPPFDHDLFRRGKGLGPAKGRIYALLKKPLTAQETAQCLGYKNARNVRGHLSDLVSEGLVKRVDGRQYERSGANLDTVAARHGVLGATHIASQRYKLQREDWTNWVNAFHHWLRTGELVDPTTGELLAIQHNPGKHLRMHTFRERLLAARAAGAADVQPDQKRNRSGPATFRIIEPWSAELMQMDISTEAVGRDAVGRGSK